MTKEDVYEILHRWNSGQSISMIASVERCDRKTIRKYIQKFNAAGLRSSRSLPGKEKIWEIIDASILPSVERVRPASKQLEPLIKPIQEMIQDSKEPIKPKSPFKVLKAKHNIDVSYETFKNFIRKRELSKKPLKQMIRIELPPGLETQIDYGKIGLLEDPSTGKEG